MPVKIELEPHEITVILKALQEQPYNRVAAIIHKIVNQTNTVKEDTPYGTY